MLFFRRRDQEMWNISAQDRRNIALMKVQSSFGNTNEREIRRCGICADWIEGILHNEDTVPVRKYQ